MFLICPVPVQFHQIFLLNHYKNQFENCKSGTTKIDKTAQKGGFHHDGDERQSFRMPDGKYVNQCRFSKLITEYEKSQR